VSNLTPVFGVGVSAYTIRRSWRLRKETQFVILKVLITRKQN